MIPTSEKIYNTALRFIGTDASPKGLANNELACAEAVSNILFEAGCVIPEFVSTTKLNYFLKTSSKWMKVAEPLRGDVIISPTGEGGKNGISHGHTGIIMQGGKVASNDSSTGKLLENYTLQSWKERYEAKGGYHTYLYRLTSSPELPLEVATVAQETIEVASEALGYPELKFASLGLLGALLRFLTGYNK